MQDGKIADPRPESQRLSTLMEHSEEPVNRDLRGTFIGDMPTVRAFFIPASGVHSDYDMTSENDCYAGSSKCNPFAERGRNGCCEDGGRRRFSGTSC